MKKPPCRCNSNLISSPQPGKPSDGLVVGWCDTRWWTNYVVYMSTPGGHEKKNIWSGHPDCSEEKLSFDKVLISLRMVGYKIWNMKECRTRTPRGICQKLFFPIKSRAILELGRSRVVNLVVYRRMCFELSNTVLVLIINMHNTNFCALVIMKYVDKCYWSNSWIFKIATEENRIIFEWIECLDFSAGCFNFQMEEDGDWWWWWACLCSLLMKYVVLVITYLRMSLIMLVQKSRKEVSGWTSSLDVLPCVIVVIKPVKTSKNQLNTIYHTPL